MKATGLITHFLDKMGVVRVTLAASIFLSWIAISGSITPNNDGMLYIEAARLYQQGGYDEVRQFFNWMVFSRVFIAILLAKVSVITGLSLEASGYFLSTFFLSGTCAILVMCVRLRHADAAWAACAVVLTLPALNVYRDHIIREFGAWFFISLACWFILQWDHSLAWGKALLAQACIFLAALFRPESIAFLAAIFMWQLTRSKDEFYIRRILSVAAIPLLGAAVLAVVWLTHAGEVSQKISGLFRILSPTHRMDTFNEAASRMGEFVLKKWSADEAKSILLFGLLSIIPLKLITNLGIFTLPATSALIKGRMGKSWQLWAPFWWMLLTYSLVLAAFVLERTYLTARYVALLSLFFVPMIAVELFRLYSGFPKLRVLIAVIIGITGVSNVISTTPQKTRFTDAASWLSAQKIEESKAYIENQEIAHLVGWRFTKARRGLTNRGSVLEALGDGRIDLALFDDSTNNRDFKDWLADNNLEVLAQFHDGRQRMVVAARLKKPRKSDSVR